MSFGAVAGDYDRLRPEPPEAAVDWLVPPACHVAADLGAGTGLLSRALARKVPHVVAVEPDERMAAVLRSRSPGIRVLEGRGEAIPLPDASADAVFASSAWHWMDPDMATAEIARVLRDGGRFGLIWTSRDREVGWLQDLDRFRDSADRRDSGERRGSRAREVSLPGGLFGQGETAAFTFSRRMTVDDLVGMLATYSGLITASPRDRAAGLAGARDALYRRFPGAAEIDVPMRSWCWRADRVPRPASPEHAASS